MIIWFSFILSNSIFYPINAYAYIDPMSGSIIVQAIIAASVGIMIYVKTSWLKLKTFFLNIIKRENVDKKTKK